MYPHDELATTADVSAFVPEARNDIRKEVTRWVATRTYFESRGSKMTSSEQSRQVDLPLQGLVNVLTGSHLGAAKVERLSSPNSPRTYSKAQIRAMARRRKETFHVKQTTPVVRKKK